MKKRMVLLMSMTVMLSVCTEALLAEHKGDATGHKLYTAKADGDKELGITFRNTFATKYIWRGYDRFNARGAWMPELDFDLFGTGFGANVWMAQPFSSGAEDASELNYTLYYANTVNEGDVSEMDYTAYYRYYDFFKANRHQGNQEVGIETAFPKLLSEVIPGLVPSYAVSQVWFNEADSTSFGSGEGGAFHVLALDYPLEILNCPVAEALNMHTLNLHSDLTYNDGYAGADSDWSHATLGISSNMEVAGVAFEPFLNYQISMDDSVNPNDELWGGVTTSISF